MAGDRPEDSGGGMGHRRQRHGPNDLTPEEKAVLKQCNRESFFYRSLPFSVVAMSGAHFAVHRGILSPHPRFGSLLKVVGFGFVGYFAGKISYLKECRKKILALPNSRLADQIRNPSRDTFIPPNAADNEDYHMTTPTTAGSRDVDDRGRDYDTQAANQIDRSGMDDSKRPSLDSNQSTPFTPAESEDTNKSSPVTYEELRKKNRENSPNIPPRPRQDFGRRPWTQPQPIGDIRQPDTRQSDTRQSDMPKPKRKTNKYGDDMD